ncbi:PspC domain-containing protein [Terriglobus roseus]|uniref:Phage shock protein C (PspC) family protein n=1 Tax=Terriglobus roseus TaxID=392734 RepID=A0A1H4J6B3_9BACT|nr:PspC domain-containing protein [Terriglobus roseus]SEB41168.1 phage shock protein C (PspC) family protein [Terriglobus roseus]
MNGPLLRPRYGRKIAGVCAAFARAYGWDLNLTRLVLVLLVFFGGGGVLAYIVCWLVIPEEPLVLPYSGTYPPPVAGSPYPPTGYPPADYPSTNPPSKPPVV